MILYLFRFCQSKTNSLMANPFREASLLKGRWNQHPPLRYPIYQLMETMSPSIEVLWGASEKSGKLRARLWHRPAAAHMQFALVL